MTPLQVLRTLAVYNTVGTFISCQAFSSMHVYVTESLHSYSYQYKNLVKFNRYGLTDHDLELLLNTHAQKNAQGTSVIKQNYLTHMRYFLLLLVL